MLAIRKHPLMTVTTLVAAILWVCREASRGEHKHGFMATISGQDDPLLDFTGRPMSREVREFMTTVGRQSKPRAWTTDHPDSITRRLAEADAVQSYFAEP
jgi:hypothetical protein